MAVVTNMSCVNKFMQFALYGYDSMKDQNYKGTVFQVKLFPDKRYPKLSEARVVVSNKTTATGSRADGTKHNLKNNLMYTHYFPQVMKWMWDHIIISTAQLVVAI